ncbi:hypothetical protein [Streptomyces sp. NPDC018352]|uniref:hypothetical protein n=1 Tax=Streptomyces sp. NPDC018352 TaxID=3157194 RepID=UPI0033F8133E
MSDRDKDVEILALRRQLPVPERQLGGEKVRFSPRDRAFMAALLHRPPRDVLRRLRLLVRPDTVLRWHRDLVARPPRRRVRQLRRQRRSVRIRIGFVEHQENDIGPQLLRPRRS